jgi:hypothetical protein
MAREVLEVLHERHEDTLDSVARQVGQHAEMCVSCDGRHRLAVVLVGFCTTGSCFSYCLPLLDGPVCNN